MCVCRINNIINNIGAQNRACVLYSPTSAMRTICAIACAIP